MTVSPFRSLIAASLVALSAGTSAAQQWPSGPIRVALAKSRPGDLSYGSVG